jgi:hypothetical protein
LRAALTGSIMLLSLNTAFFERTVLMMGGYKEAADLLVEAAIAERFHRDQLVYPIVFCYRHYLELELKYIINNYGRLVGVPPNTEDHDLEELWPAARRVITLDRPETADPAIDAVEAAIAEFSKIDPSSFTFRYPTDKKGQPIAIGVEHLDLEQLRDTMKGIGNFFMGADGLLDEAERNFREYQDGGEAW